MTSPRDTNRSIQRHFRIGGRNRNLPWYPSRGTRNDLANLFYRLKFTVGIEVGTREGVYAEILCKSNPDLFLTCVDPWVAYSTRTQEWMDARYNEAVSRLAQYNCTLMREPSLKAVHKFRDAALDFVFIDGNHIFDEAVRDIIEWVPKVKIGGIVAVHDYHPWVGCDVVAAVDAYTRSHHINPWYVTRESEPTAFWVREEKHNH